MISSCGYIQPPFSSARRVIKDLPSIRFPVSRFLFMLTERAELLAPQPSPPPPPPPDTLVDDLAAKAQSARKPSWNVETNQSKPPLTLSTKTNSNLAAPSQRRQDRQAPVLDAHRSGQDQQDSIHHLVIDVSDLDRQFACLSICEEQDD